MHSMLGSLLWLLVVLASIPVSLWLLKRSTWGARLSGQAQQHLQPVSSLTLGNGQRLVTVEVCQGQERRWLILGVTNHSITPVHSMPAPARDQPAASPGDPTDGSFTSFMRHLRGTPNHE